MSFHSAEPVVPQSGDASRHSSLTKSNDLSPVELARRRNVGQPGPTHQQPSSPQEQSWAGRPVPVRRRTGGKRSRTPASADRHQPRKPAKQRRQGRKGRALQAPRQLVDPLETYARQISLRQRCNAASAALLTGKSSEMRVLHMQAPLEQLRQIQPPQTRPSSHAASAQAVRPAHDAAAASRLQAEPQLALRHLPAPTMTQQQAPMAKAPHQKASPDPKQDGQPILDHTRSRSSGDPDQAVQASDHDTCSMDPAAQHTIPRRTQQAVSVVRTRTANAGLSTRARSLMGLASPHGAPDQVHQLTLAARHLSCGIYSLRSLFVLAVGAQLQIAGRPIHAAMLMCMNGMMDVSTAAHESRAYMALSSTSRCLVLCPMYELLPCVRNVKLSDSCWCQALNTCDPPSHAGPCRRTAAAPLKGRLKPAEPAESASPPLHDPLAWPVQPGLNQQPLLSPTLSELDSMLASPSMLSLNSTGDHTALHEDDAEAASPKQLLTLAERPPYSSSPSMSSCSSPPAPMGRSPALSGLASIPALEQRRLPPPAWHPQRQLRSPQPTPGSLSRKQQAGSWDAFMIREPLTRSLIRRDSTPRNLAQNMSWVAALDLDAANDFGSDLLLDRSPLQHRKTTSAAYILAGQPAAAQGQGAEAAA